MLSTQQQVEIIRCQIQDEQMEYMSVNDALGGGVFFHPELIDSEATAHSDNLIIRAIFKSVGFTFHDDRYNDHEMRAVTVGIPDGERLIKAAKQHAIPITLVDELEPIGQATPVKTFVDNYRAGLHTVGTAELDLYIHDVGFDHLPAIIVCGNDLMDIFSTIPQAQDDYEYSLQGQWLDNATSDISEGVLWKVLGAPRNDEFFERAALHLSRVVKTRVSAKKLIKIATNGLQTFATVNQ